MLELLPHSEKVILFCVEFKFIYLFFCINDLFINYRNDFKIFEFSRFSATNQNQVC